MDSLSATQLKPGQGIIANCDTLKGQGTHWVSLYKTGCGNCEFFDSFGRRPKDYDERFNHFLSPEYERIIHNHKVVQDYESD